MKRRKRLQIVTLSVMGMILFIGGFALGKGIQKNIPPQTAERQKKDTAQMVVLSGDENLSQASRELPWNLVLINAKHPIKVDYEPPELTYLTSGHAIDSRIYPALQQMMDDARSEGLDPLICSSFRTRQKQETLYNNKVQYYLDQGQSRQQAEESAVRWVQRPDTSEHQIGLAVDIVDASYQMLDEEQEQTPVQIWLMKHCAEYGFILRYPTDKSDITGVNYEPWHYRYVGVEAARTIMERSICLEEYLSERQQ